MFLLFNNIVWFLNWIVARKHIYICSLKFIFLLVITGKFNTLSSAETKMKAGCNKTSHFENIWVHLMVIIVSCEPGRHNRPSCTDTDRNLMYPWAVCLIDITLRWPLLWTGTILIKLTCWALFELYWKRKLWTHTRETISELSNTESFF